MNKYTKSKEDKIQINVSVQQSRTKDEFFDSVLPAEFTDDPYLIRYLSKLFQSHSILRLFITVDGETQQDLGHHGRLLRLAVAGGRIVVTVFFCTLLHYIYLTDDGTCESYEDGRSCESQLMFDMKTTQCIWFDKLDYCTVNEPKDSIRWCVQIAFITCTLSSPINRLLLRLAREASKPPPHWSKLTSFTLVRMILYYLARMWDYCLISIGFRKQQQDDNKHISVLEERLKPNTLTPLTSQKNSSSFFGLRSVSKSPGKIQPGVEENIDIYTGTKVKNKIDANINNNSDISYVTRIEDRHVIRDDELEGWQSFRSTVLRAARLNKMQRLFDFPTVENELDVTLLNARNKLALDYIVKGGYGIPAACKTAGSSSAGITSSRDLDPYKSSKLINELTISRYESTQLKLKMIAARPNRREALLMRHFYIGMLPPTKKRLAQLYLAEPFDDASWRLPFAIPIFLGLIVVMMYFIIDRGALLGDRSTPLLRDCIIYTLVFDILLLQPLKTLISYGAMVSLIRYDIVRVHTILQQRAHMILSRTSGVMRDFNSLCQHFNPACRTARSFPGLPIARVLMSLNDVELLPPTNWLNSNGIRNSKSFPSTRVADDSGGFALFWSPFLMLASFPLFLMNKIIPSKIHATLIDLMQTMLVVLITCQILLMYANVNSRTNAIVILISILFIFGLHVMYEDYFISTNKRTTTTTSSSGTTSSRKSSKGFGDWVRRPPNYFGSQQKLGNNKYRIQPVDDKNNIGYGSMFNIGDEMSNATKGMNNLWNTAELNLLGTGPPSLSVSSEGKLDQPFQSPVKIKPSLSPSISKSRINSRGRSRGPKHAVAPAPQPKPARLWDLSEEHLDLDSNNQLPHDPKSYQAYSLHQLSQQPMGVPIQLQRNADVDDESLRRHFDSKTFLDAQFEREFAPQPILGLTRVPFPHSAVPDHPVSSSSNILKKNIKTPELKLEDINDLLSLESTELDPTDRDYLRLSGGISALAAVHSDQNESKISSVSSGGIQPENILGPQLGEIAPTVPGRLPPISIQNAAVKDDSTATGLLQRLNLLSLSIQQQIDTDDPHAMQLAAAAAEKEFADAAAENIAEVEAKAEARRKQRKKAKRKEKRKKERARQKSLERVRGSDKVGLGIIHEEESAEFDTANDTEQPSADDAEHQTRQDEHQQNGEHSRRRSRHRGRGSRSRQSSSVERSALIRTASRSRSRSKRRALDRVQEQEENGIGAGPGRQSHLFEPNEGQYISNRAYMAGVSIDEAAPSMIGSSSDSVLPHSSSLNGNNINSRMGIGLASASTNSLLIDSTNMSPQQQEGEDLPLQLMMTDATRATEAMVNLNMDSSDIFRMMIEADEAAEVSAIYGPGGGLSGYNHNDNQRQRMLFDEYLQDDEDNINGNGLDNTSALDGMSLESLDADIDSSLMNMNSWNKPRNNRNTNLSYTSNNMNSDPGGRVSGQSQQLEKSQQSERFIRRRRGRAVSPGPAPMVVVLGDGLGGDNGTGSVSALDPGAGVYNQNGPGLRRLAAHASNMHDNIYHEDNEINLRK